MHHALCRLRRRAARKVEMKPPPTQTSPALAKAAANPGLRASTLVLCAMLASMGASKAAADPAPPPQNVVTLSASAATEVAKDWLTVVFGTTVDGADATAVQAQLRQALDAALTEARKAARPGQVEVQTGAFALYPRYAPASAKAAASGLPGGLVGWSGSTELVVEGRDTAAISQLAGRVRTLTIARVGYSLSREARQQVEADVAAQAIDRFRARADAVSRQFGFGGYTLRELTVSADAPMVQPMALTRMSAVRAATDEPLPVEAGKATVTATVSGSVQMR